VAVLTAVDLADLPLLDGHCHRVDAGSLPDNDFMQWCTESVVADSATADSQLGVAIRRWCAPLLGLPPHVPMAEYLAARRAVGGTETTRQLLRSARLSGLLVDTGISTASMLTVDDLAVAAEAPAFEVVRLESLAESMHGSVTARSFADDFAEALRGRLENGAMAMKSVAVKSIAAYRCGLDFAPDRPSTAEVCAAADGWLAGPPRLFDPVLIRHLLWCAADAGRPIQLHTGFGDADASLTTSNPAVLQGFCAATQATGVPLVLLHCYPYHREAGWLAHLYPHVYVDVGLTVNFVGARAAAVLGEFLELTPFGRLLYSSDAYGLAELYLVGAAQFRHSLGRVLGELVADDSMSAAEARRLAEAIGADNARRLYAC